MHPDACQSCGADPWRYVTGCDACEARLYARVRVRTARDVLVSALRRIEVDSGRAFAERVRQQAIEQRQLYGR